MRGRKRCVNADEDFGVACWLTRRVPPPPPDPGAVLRRQALGRRLRELRAGAGLTQEAVAQTAGLERAFYAKLEAGQHGVLTDRLWDLAGALGVDPGELFPPDPTTDVPGVRPGG